MAENEPKAKRVEKKKGVKLSYYTADVLIVPMKRRALGKSAWKKGEKRKKKRKKWGEGVAIRPQVNKHLPG